MNRLGLAGRLMLLLAVAMILVQLLALGIFLDQRRMAVPGRLSLPYPDQMAAMVTLFNQADPAERSLLLRSFSGSATIVSLAPAPPETEPPGTTSPGHDMLLPVLSESLRDYAAVLGERPLQAAIAADERSGPLPRLRALLDPTMVRIAIQLDDGTWLILQRGSPPGVAILGLPAGSLGALVAALVAALSILAVWRETRPLQRLSRAATRFGASLRPEPLPEAGAPDLRRLIGAFNRMQDQIARTDRARTDMIAAFAHDLRTPLTRLRLRLRQLPPAAEEAAARDIAAITALGDEALRFATADLARLEERLSLWQLLQGLDSRPGQSLDLGPRDAVVTGNGPLLARALANLIDNALKYGQVARVSLEVTSRQAHIAIEDDGPGIALHDRARLCEPFLRGDPARRGGAPNPPGGPDGAPPQTAQLAPPPTAAPSGTGLGLSLAQRIVTRHGGQLLLETAPGGGLRALVALPLRG